MSGRYVSAVFESDLPPDLKFTAAVLASFADEDGYQIRPSMPRVAYLRGVFERSVQYHVRELQEMAILEIVRAATQWLPTHYRMHLGKLPARPPFVPSDRQRSLLDPIGESPGPPESGVQPSAPQPGVHPSASGVHWNVLGVHPSAPDPSVDPSVRSVSTHTYAGRASEAPPPADDATGESALPLIVAPSRDPDHAAHAWCGRICVPKFLHKQLKQALGGQVTKRAARMRAFYVETFDAIPAVQLIGQVDPVKFWRGKFAAKYGGAAPRAVAAIRHEGATGGWNCDHEPEKCTSRHQCIDRTLADGRAARERKSS